MKMWVQICGREQDDEYPDTASYEILAGGVLRVTSGNDVRLYSPARWEEVMVDTRATDDRAMQAEPLNEDLKWQ